MSYIIYKELSDLIINSAFRVHSRIGPGLLEIIYKRALLIELLLQNIDAEKEKEYSVYYEKHKIGTYYADIVAANQIIIEIKAVKKLDANMEAQLFNYLRISGIKVGYLINFSPRIMEFKRLVI